MEFESLSKKQQFIYLSSVGFTLGVIVCGIISVTISTMLFRDGTVHFCNPEFIEMVGDPTLAILIQVLAEGLYGVISIGGTVVYNIEEWSLLRVTLTHYLMTVISFFTMAFTLKWFYVSSPRSACIFFVIFSLAYMMVWLERYLSYKSQIREINAGLARMKSAGQ